MGGQTASPGSLHLDMRRLNQVVWLLARGNSASACRAGIRWCDIQKFVDPARARGQDHADLRQLHRRRIAERQRARALRRPRPAHPLGALDQAGADERRARRKRAPSSNAEIFYGAIGGYGGLGVIVEAELDLADNTRVERVAVQAAGRAYAALTSARTCAIRAARGVPQRRPLRARTTRTRARGHLGRDRQAGHRALPPAAAPARLPARELLPVGGLGDAVRQVAARVHHRPAALPARRRCTGATSRRATTWPSSSRRRASIAPTCCRNTSCRSSASTSSCRRWPRSSSATA